MARKCVYKVRYIKGNSLGMVCMLISMAIPLWVLYSHIYFYEGGPKSYHAAKVGSGTYFMTPFIIVLVVYYFLALFRPAVKVCEDGLRFTQMYALGGFFPVFNLGYGFVGWDNVDLLIIDEPVPGVSSYDGAYQTLRGSCVGVVVKDVDRVCGSRRMRRRARREFAKSGKHFVFWVSCLELEDVYQGCKVLREIVANSRFNFDVYDSRKEIPYRKVWGAFTPNCEIEGYHNSRQTVLENGKFVPTRKFFSKALKVALLWVLFYNGIGILSMRDYVWNGVPVAIVWNTISAVMFFMAILLKLPDFIRMEKAAIKYGYIPIYFPNTTLPKLQ